MAKRKVKLGRVSVDDASILSAALSVLWDALDEPARALTSSFRVANPVTEELSRYRRRASVIQQRIDALIVAAENERDEARDEAARHAS